MAVSKRLSEEKTPLTLQPGKKQLRCNGRMADTFRFEMRQKIKW